MKSPENGRDERKERCRAVHLATNHPTIHTSGCFRNRMLQVQQFRQFVPNLSVMSRQKELLLVTVTSTIRLPTLLSRNC